MPSTVQDETQYCENCGISFLWTGEEQRKVDADPPMCCPGCRQILPKTARERGMVKWYNGRKRFGFIVRPGEEDLFVHRSAIKDKVHLHEGDLVEYGVVETKNGPAARSVRVLKQEDP